MTSFRQSRGFTLIELMIVVAIVAILTAIAVPMYQQQSMTSRRADAKSALLDLATREERYFATNNTYTNDPTQLYGTGATFPLSVPSSGTPDYNITVVTPAGAAATGTTYSLSATPINLQANDTCGTYLLDNTGSQTNSGNTSTSCW